MVPLREDCCTKLLKGPVMTGESLLFLGAEVEGFSAGLLGDCPEGETQGYAFLS